MILARMKFWMLTLGVLCAILVTQTLAQNMSTPGPPNVTTVATSGSPNITGVSPSLATTNTSTGGAPYKIANQTTPTFPASGSTASPTPGVYDCQLGADPSFREDLAHALGGSNKLVELHITLHGYPTDHLDRVLTHVYRPQHWIRASGRQGHSLLMLDETYSYMSLTTLSIGVTDISTNVTSHPPNCLVGLMDEDLLMVMRRSFLNDFKVLSPGDGSGSLSADEHICNYHIEDDDGYAKFRYTCCRVYGGSDIVCEEVIRNDWLKGLLVLVLVIKIIVVLFSPMLIPESMYRLKYVAANYIYRLPEGAPPASVKVVVTQTPGQYGEENKHKRVRLSQLKNMEVFKALVGSSRWVPEKVYEVKMRDVRLSVKTRRLLTRSAMPVTITKMIYNNLIRCRIRKLEPLAPCCETNILGKFNSGLKVIKWSQLMKIVAGFLLMFVLFIPWIVRTLVYATNDKDIFEERERAAEKVGLKATYSGSLVIYLTPLHIFFIFIYVIFIIDSVVYGVISKPMKEKLKYVLRQCLRDMKERSRLAVLSWMTKLIVWPFKTCGLLGIFIFPIYLALVLVFTLPIIAFYIFPTLNLSMRLIIHLFIFMCPPRVTKTVEGVAHRFTTMRDKLKINEVTANETFIKRSDYTNKGIAFQLVVIIMCLISFWSVTLLIMEVCSFFVELLMYTFMGVIVNAATTMKFVTVFFLLYLYASQIFTSVSKDYVAYHKIIHDELVKMKRPEINEVAKKEALDQENTAFRVGGEMATNIPVNPEPVIKVKDHEPQWSTSGMLVFLDSYDNAMTPERFFFETINLNYGGCPGPIYKQMVAAVKDFSRVILFLVFVFVVVMAFGDAYQVSTTNQLLATVAGGFVPFLFRYIFKADTGGPNVDTSSIQFLTEFHKVINGYKQSWNVFDIQPASVQEWDEDAKPADEAMDGNGNESKDPNGSADPNSSGAPLLNTTTVNLNETPGAAKEPLDRATSYISMLDDETEVDIIVDISTPKTRSVNALLKTGWERGSVSMLASSGGGSRGGGSARIYKPGNERAV